MKKWKWVGMKGNLLFYFIRGITCRLGSMVGLGRSGVLLG